MAQGRPAVPRDVAPTLAPILPTLCEAQEARASARGIPRSTPGSPNPTGAPGQERAEPPAAQPPPHRPNLCSPFFPSFHDNRLAGGRGGRIIPPGAGGMLYWHPAAGRRRPLSSLLPSKGDMLTKNATAANPGWYPLSAWEKSSFSW